MIFSLPPLRRSFLLLAAILFQLFLCIVVAQTPPSIHVEGNHLADTHGNEVWLHGVMDTPHPYFNHWRWGRTAEDANVEACLDYFEKLFTAITDTTQGAHCTVFRLHLDPVWTNDPKLPKTGDAEGEANISQFSETRLKRYFRTVYWPIIKKALNHGLYVVVRPPGVCPQEIRVGGEYQAYLMKVWNIVSKQSNMKKYAGQVSIELANEPVRLLDKNGRETSRACHDFFQPIVDTIRANGFDGIVWVPGTGWQSHYESYSSYPIQGPNIGYAVHAYVGWYNNNDANASESSFISNFQRQVPVVKKYPVIITEVDWSPEKEGTGHYDEHGNWVTSNWGTWATGTTSRWGNAFKGMKDHFGNISMTLTGTDEYVDMERYLRDGTVVPAFEGNPEACGAACFKWYAEYAKTKFPVPDDATGISSIEWRLESGEQGEESGESPRYNLQGQRVSKGYKGVVIQGCKKIIIK